MRFLRQSLVGVFLASLTLALLVYAGQLVMGAIQQRMSDDKQAPPARERVFAVNVRLAEIQTVTPFLRAFGQVESRRTLELRAAQGGRVIGLSDSFVEGGEVVAGETLVQVDPANAQSALDRAESDLLDARTEEGDALRSLDLARDELSAAEEQADLRDRALQRQRDLEARGVGTAAAVEAAELSAASARQAMLSRRIAIARAEARIDQAAAMLSRARIAVEAARRDLADTQVTARFDGTLSGVTLVEGRLVSPNEKLAELVDPNQLEVAFRVSTAQYTRLLDPSGRLIQSPVTATLEATGSDLTASGSISRDSAAAGEGQTGRLIFADLDTARGFKPGDFVTVQVEEPPLSDVVRLPASVLGPSGTVLVLGPDDRLEELPVTLVRRQGDDVLLRGVGLQGQEVVVGRTPLLGAGIRVRPVRNSAALNPEVTMLELSEERRARLVAFVESSDAMAAEDKARVLDELSKGRVPAGLVRRIETRMGG